MPLFDGLDLAQLEKGYKISQANKAVTAGARQVAPKKGGRGGTLTSLISEGGALGGGATGAAIGTAILPGVGTLLGGALGAGIGAFGGRVAENEVRDGRLGIGDAAKEGAITAALSAPGKFLKGGASIAKSVGKNEGLTEALLKAGTAATTKRGTAGAIANKVRTGATDRSNAGFGLKVGATNKGKVQTPEEIDRLSDFVNNRSTQYGGIKPGAPASQARDAQAVYKNVVKELDSHLNQIDRPVASKERSDIINSLQQRVSNDAGVTGTKEITQNFRKKIIGAKSVKDLENIRKEADNISFKESGGKGSTAKAAEASHVRDSIDEFVTQLSPEYKAIKGDYGDAKQALDLISKAAKDPKGIPLPFVNGGFTGTGVGGNLVASTRNKANALVAGTGAAPSLGTASPITTGLRMGAQGDLGDAILGAQGSMNDATMPTAQDMSTTAMNNSNMDTEYQNQDDLSSINPYPRENLLADIQRDPAHMDDYIKLYQQYQEVFAASGDDLSQTTKSSLASSDNAINTIDQLENLFTNAGSGSGRIGGAVKGLAASAGFDENARVYNNLSQASVTQIAKALAGAGSGTVSDMDAKVIIAALPTISDTPREAAAKFAALRQRLEAARSNSLYYGSGGTGTDSSSNLTDALMQAGYN